MKKEPPILPDITFTGVDVRTDLRALKEIDAEFGILYSATNKGNRYPARDYVLIAAKAITRASLHVCGDQAKEELFTGALDDILEHVGRVQVNGAVTAGTMNILCDEYPDIQFITQHSNPMLSQDLLTRVTAGNHAILVDGSGGRGLSPDAWAAPRTWKRTGFAGGLGPDNLWDELGRIEPHTGKGWWVDMEGKIRTDDWFDIEKVRSCMKTFVEFCLGHDNSLFEALPYCRHDVQGKSGGGCACTKCGGWFCF